jgi:ubiquitin carboxyl-terminal hydrolase 12/46
MSLHVTHHNAQVVIFVFFGDWMGSGPSSLEPELAAALPTTSERFIGLRNYGNICFANSVLQLLFRCEPLRSHLVQWSTCVRADEAKEASSWFGLTSSHTSSVLDLLGELFYRMQNNVDRTGTTGADDLIALIKRKNEHFDSRQQDAQEFYSFVVNELGEAVQREQKRQRADAASDPFRGVVCRVFEETLGKTFVHGTFEGLCTSSTVCRTCQGKTSRTETFFEVSLEISANSDSVAQCLRRFSEVEVLEKANGFHCDACAASGTQPAEKRMVLTKLPKVLVLHLKRFQYHAAQQRFVKLSHRISFSTELKVVFL